MNKRDILNNVLRIMVEIQMISVKSAMELGYKFESDSNLYYEIKGIIWNCRHTHTDLKFESQLEEIRLYLKQYK